MPLNITQIIGSERDHNIHIIPSLWDEIEKVPDVDNENLFGPFSKQEIKDALFSMETNKSCWS